MQAYVYPVADFFPRSGADLSLLGRDAAVRPVVRNTINDLQAAAAAAPTGAQTRLLMPVFNISVANFAPGFLIMSTIYDNDPTLVRPDRRPPTVQDAWVPRAAEHRHCTPWLVVLPASVRGVMPLAIGVATVLRHAWGGGGWVTGVGM